MPVNPRTLSDETIPQSPKTSFSGHPDFKTVSLGSPNCPISAKVAVPDRIDADLPPLVAIHGISRDFAGVANAFAAPAKAQGRILIVPHYAQKDWPEFQRIGRARPDLALLALLENLRAGGTLPAGRISLFGFSGGAQLAHRFAMLYPHLVASLHVAAAGWYCLPDESLPWPAGLGAPDPAASPHKARFYPAARAQIDAYLRLRLRVYCGEGDTHRDPAMRTDPQIDSGQGRNRLTRAETYVRHFKDAAAARGVSADARLIVLEGCGHDFTECAIRAGLARLILS